MKKENIQISEYSVKAPFNLRAAVVSDFHNGDPGKVLAIFEKGKKPDLILIPGDVILGYLPEKGSLVIETSANVLPLLKGCANIAPTYMSLGNHECLLASEDTDLIRSTGVILLDNEWTEYGSGDTKLLIGGLTSTHVLSYNKFRDEYNKERLFRNEETLLYPERRRPKGLSKVRTESSWLDGFEAAEGYKILLSHHPEFWSMREPMLKDRRIDLVLSGHAHGGQWRIFGHGIFAPGQGLFPKYTEGIHCGPYGQLIVSRGLSNPYRKIPRLGNPCEVVLIELGQSS